MDKINEFYGKIMNVDLSKYLGYIIYLAFGNSVLLKALYYFEKALMEKGSGMHLDGADFSFFYNFFAFGVNLVLSGIVFMILLLFVIIGTAIFNKFYFKNVDETMLEDLKTLSILAAVISEIALIAILGFFHIYWLILYPMIILMAYNMTSLNIKRKIKR